VGKDTVSRVWRKTKGDWDTWNARSLTDEPIIRLILDGTVVRVRLDKKATSISLLVALGVRSDGQKVLLAIKNMGGESEAAWRALLDNLVARGLKTPELVIVDGSSGLDKALAALWSDVLVQRCTVHKHRNLLAHAPDRLHEEVSADYNDMIYAKTKQEIEASEKSSSANGGSNVTPSPIAWKKREIDCSPSRASRKPMEIDKNNQCHRTLARGIQAANQDANRPAKRRNRRHAFLALLASGQIVMRKVDGWPSLSQKPSDQTMTLPHDPINSTRWRLPQANFNIDCERHPVRRDYTEKLVFRIDSPAAVAPNIQGILNHADKYDASFHG